LTTLTASVRIGSMKKSRSHFNLILRPEPEGGFTVIVPALPGCVTFGRDIAEAKKMAKDAIAGYIESLKKHKEPIPTDDESLVTSLEFEYAETSRR
jgi:antitoxin HicB